MSHKNSLMVTKNSLIPVNFSWTEYEVINLMMM